MPSLYIYAFCAMTVHPLDQSLDLTMTYNSPFSNHLLESGKDQDSILMPVIWSKLTGSGEGQLWCVLTFAMMGVPMYISLTELM